VLVVTTNVIEGKKITRYHGIVSGGRSAAYEEELRKAKDIAIEEMTRQAASAGCNAVIGVDLDYETIGSNGSMLMVSASGTAVVIDG
jgi:uncharacterized protein YbjQ (UPF0145 family)